MSCPFPFLLLLPCWCSPACSAAGPFDFVLNQREGSAFFLQVFFYLSEASFIASCWRKAFTGSPSLYLQSCTALKDLSFTSPSINARFDLDACLQAERKLAVAQVEEAAAANELQVSYEALPLHIH